MSHRGIKALKENQEKNRVRRERAAERKPFYMHDAEDKDDCIYKADFPDSLYGLRMLLRKDGRKRGLWVWLEEEVTSRQDTDNRVFDEGVKKIIPELQKLFAEKDQTMLEFKLVMALRRHFDFFFSHRLEGMAIRLSWKTVLAFATKLKAGHAAEKEKTEDYD